MNAKDITEDQKQEAATAGSTHDNGQVHTPAAETRHPDPAEAKAAHDRGEKAKEENESNKIDMPATPKAESGKTYEKTQGEEAYAKEKTAGQK